jgi:hypothetical protein
MDVQKMDIVQRPVIFHLRFKEEGSNIIHREFVETSEAGAYTIQGV